MQGLTGFHHDKVGNIDNIVYYLDADRLQSLLQPQRRRSDCYFVDDLAVEDRTFSRFSGDIQAGRYFMAFNMIVRQLDRLINDGPYLFCHGPPAQTVGPVRCQGDIQDGIVKIKIAQDIRIADDRVIRQHFDAIQLLFRQRLFIDAQFKQRTDHTVRILTSDNAAFYLAVRQHTSRQGDNDFLTGGDIGGAADNLNDFFPGVYLADMQMVAVRMSRAFINLADDKLASAGCRQDIFDFKAGCR